MQQKIILKIENFVPSVVYSNQKGVEKKLTENETNIAKLMINIAHDLKLINNIDTEFAELLRIASEGDEHLKEDMPVLNTKVTDLEIEKHIKETLKALIKDRVDYTTYNDVSNEVLKELTRNQNTDILATLFELIYNILIARTLYFATDLGIGNIALKENNNLPRLKERMASELTKMDIMLEIL